MCSFLSCVLILFIRPARERCSNTVGAYSTMSSRLACLNSEERVNRTPVTIGMPWRDVSGGVRMYDN